MRMTGVVGDNIFNIAMRVVVVRVRKGAIIYADYFCRYACDC